MLWPSRLISAFLILLKRNIMGVQATKKKKKKVVSRKKTGFQEEGCSQPIHLAPLPGPSSTPSWAAPLCSTVPGWADLLSAETSISWDCKSAAWPWHSFSIARLRVGLCALLHCLSFLLPRENTYIYIKTIYKIYLEKKPSKR